MTPSETSPSSSWPANAGQERRPATPSPLPISLPKGGGAIRGIGEKFATNAVTGTGSVTVPIPASAGRSGFGPQLNLAYDSGTGKTAFGFGWTISLPSITRKTDKGLPTYNDQQESDVFLLSGSEDLVPMLRTDGKPDVRERTIGTDKYLVRRYRPRIEGQFAQIERWTHTRSGDTHWRSISRDNITTLYGSTDESRIFAPPDPATGGIKRIFTWLICESFDDKGNAVVYGYKPEDHAKVDLGQAHERNRSAAARTANRYLKSIRYGNVASRLNPQAFAATKWLFELVFDYGEHHPTDPRPGDTGTWLCRRDPFSSYRSGFEVRTYRLCQRIFMFHHVPNEPDVGDDCLVRSLELRYRPAPDQPNDTQHGDPLASFITSVTQTGFRRRNGGYVSRSLPPLEFSYTVPVIDQTLRTVEDVENLPVGADGHDYQLVDLDGEGVVGVLTQQTGAWYYKPGLGNARFGALRPVAAMPSMAVQGRPQLLDLAGDGQLDVVDFAGPTPGFAERTPDGGWANPVPFRFLPNIAWENDNLRLVDLNGDGHADVLLTEDEALAWYPSLGEEGFGAARQVPQAHDEETGPRLVFADGTQSVYLASMSGDGLTDLVRIRNGEVCYWPNLGYGRFGAKVTMDDSPLFDRVDRFDQQRVRLADIDGSGSNDLIYLAADGIRVWFNQSGNRWSAAHPLSQAPAVENVSTVTTADLLGNGTACLVWSSPLPAHARQPLRYIDLMGGTKPHLLVAIVNNLGAETRVSYAPSTRFYLADKAAGRPWATRLPFPVHVVERVVTDDRISRNRFITRYAYHHGYFDGEEREFRGFGLVEQFDSDEFGAFTADGAMPAASNAEPGLHVPVVLTRTWFHTGAYLQERGISRQYATEYYHEPGRTPAELDAMLLDDTVLPDTMLRADGSRTPFAPTPEEQREACRALKGMVLRREVYALDGSDNERRPYTVTESNYTVEALQARGDQRHAIFFTHPRESISYRYERTLYPAASGEPVADPRVAHDLTLEVDPFGNVLKSASVGYGRRHPDTSLATADRAIQSATRMTYTERPVTNPVTEPDETTVGDDYRAPMPWETRVYELTGYTPSGPAGRLRHEDLVRRDGQRLVHVYDSEIPHEQRPTNGRQRRLIQRERTLLRSNDLTTLLPGGVLQARAMAGESYRLAFTPGLLASVFQRPHAGQPTETLLPNPGAVLGGQGGDRGGYVDLDSDGHWWIPSGQLFHSPNANDTPAQELSYGRDHFFLGLRHRDAFGQTTTVEFDEYDLLVRQSRDPLGNRMTVGERKPNGDIDTTKPGNDYRTLQPALVTDANRNRTAVAFDALGLVVGTAVMGKPEETQGDSLDGFDPDRSPADVLADPRAALGRASTRLSYDVLAYERTRNEDIPWPASAHTLAREVHDADPGGAQTRIQQSFSYSDGLGREVQKKIQAEPGPAPRRDAGGAIILGPDGEPEMTTTDVTPRWVAAGWTVFNNKGKPVRQYEPFFSDTHSFEFGTRVGVSPTVFYDPLDRAVATLHPDHTYEKVLFEAWRQVDYDRNDTVAARGDETGDPRTDPHIHGYVSGYFATPPATWQTWWSQRQVPGTDALEKAAAQQAAVHADTPTSTHVDGLGRPFLSQARNRFERGGVAVAETYASRVELDIEGNHRLVRDAVVQAGDPLGRVIMRYDYDLLGNRVSQASMEAGRRWTLTDAAGNIIRSWDSRGHRVRTGYDPLRRPVQVFVAGADDQQPQRELLTERLVYGEQHPDAEAGNLRGTLYLHADQAGMLRNEARDFKGNLLRVSRRLAGRYRAAIEWPTLDAALPAPDATGPLDLTAVNAVLGPLLEADTFTSGTTYDALNRAVTLTSPDGSVVGRGYNEASLLERIDANVRGTIINGQPVWTPFVTDIDYDAKGQRTLVRYGNGAATSHRYDRRTLRLITLLTERPAAAFPDDCPDPAPAWPGCQVQNLQYTYDPVGNITHLRDAAQQAVFFRNRRVEPSASYTYDALYRLIEATGREHLGQAGGAPIPHRHRDEPRVGIAWSDNDGNAIGAYTESYVYDAVGNVLELRHRGTDPAHAGWTREFSYGEASLLEAAKTSNRLTSTVLAGGNAPTERYRHDEHGNVSRMPHLGGTEPAQNLYWNHNDQLRQADLGGGGTAYYTYDAAGQRVRKVWEKAPGLTEERIYLGGFELFRRRNGAGQLTLQRETLHIMDDTRRIALVETRTPGTGANDPAPAQLVRYQLGNHLGSVNLELDHQAQIISYEEYTPYGCTSYQAVRSVTETPKRYRLTGKERDEETGLYYHGARYSAPWICRWTACDPALLADGPNLYLYVRADPVRLLDPNGRAAEAGHYRTAYLAAIIAGYDYDVAAKIAFYTQLPDEVRELDAKTKGIEFLAAAVATNVDKTAKQKIYAQTVDVQAGGHALTGEVAEVERANRRKIVESLQPGTALHGAAVHAYQDSFFHERRDINAMPYPPLGHGPFTSYDLISRNPGRWEESFRGLLEVLKEQAPGGAKMRLSPQEIDAMISEVKAVARSWRGTPAEASEAGIRQVIEKWTMMAAGQGNWMLGGMLLSRYEPESQGLLDWSEFTKAHPDLTKGLELSDTLDAYKEWSATVDRDVNRLWIDPKHLQVQIEGSIKYPIISPLK